jgi:predicted MFS family arabinose efflux permease
MAQVRTMPALTGTRMPMFGVLNQLVIALMAFLTVVDLFATQAILPALARQYGVSPATMGVAVNAATIGMAVAGLLAAMVSGRVDRRNVIVGALMLLALPTAGLAFAPDLATFAALRVVQGALMATAFTLTLGHLGERCAVSASPAAFAAYVTGNVASNLFGRLLSASLVDAGGVDFNFFVFAGLNLAGGVFALFALSRVPPRSAPGEPFRPLAALRQHLTRSDLRAGFAIGFCILFAFLGVFTYVGFVLVQAPLALSMSAQGLVYFVFAPAILSTPLAGLMVSRFGGRRALWLGLALAAAGLPLLLSGTLILVLAGMALIAVGTFFAQAVATGYVSRNAEGERGAASGMYLASYFSGGLVGTVILGAAFEQFGWPAVLAGVGLALALAAFLTLALRTPAMSFTPSAHGDPA